MEFLPSNKVCHADGLSRLIPKNSKPLEDTAIASLQAEVEIEHTIQYCARTIYDFGRNKKK